MRDIKYILLSLCTVIVMVASSFTLERFHAAPPPPGGGGGIVNYDTINIELSNCALQGSMCLPIRLSDALKLRITDNGQALPVDIMNGCDFDTTSAYTYSNLFGTGTAGPYIVTDWNINGTSFSDTFQTIPDLVNLMNTWDPMGNWVNDPTRLLISGGNSANVYDTMQVWVSVLQSPSFLGYNLGITPTGTELSFSRGFHQVILEDTINSIADTFYVHAFCSETINQTLPVGMSATHCLNTLDLINGQSSVGFCSDPSNTAVLFAIDSVQNCVTFTGLMAGTASACVIQCDSTGFCDTTYYNISVLDTNAVQQINLQLTAGQVHFHCFDSTNTVGNITSVAMCGSSVGGWATYALDTATNCITVTGVQEGGTDFACAVVCTDMGTCDTTYFTTIVRRIGPDVVHDTVMLNQPGGSYCVDQYQLDSINAFTPIMQPDSSFMNWTLNDSTYCFTYTGTSVGTDTLGLIISNTGGQTDTTWFILTVVPPAPSNIIDTVDLGESTMQCLSLADLFGNTYTVTNLCPGNQNGAVTFDTDTLTLCVEYTGTTPSTDSLCLAVCDNLGACDTFVFIITALDSTNLLPPVASDDQGLTDVNTPVSLPVLANDLVPGVLDPSIMIIPIRKDGTPTFGTVTIDTALNQAVYTPPTDLCDTSDQFTYVICNSVGCDTALVTVMILCDPNATKLVFYQGFSPNDDEINDKFVIKNADKYPGNELFVFNRWGNRVFYDKNYRNGWDGTWNTKPLPDGVYYYIFDNGKGQTHSDCVHIRR